MIVDTFSRPGLLPMLPVFLLLGYAILHFFGGLFVELRDMVFAPVTQSTLSAVTLEVFNHLLRIAPGFHLRRQTGALTRDLERGTAGIGFLLGAALFSIAPTLVEISAVLAIMLSAYSAVFGLIIAATFAAYVIVTLALSQKCIALQRSLNRLDAGVNGLLVDSLIN